MSVDRPPPLDPELAALLRDEAARPAPDAATKALVKADLAHKLGAAFGAAPTPAPINGPAPRASGDDASASAPARIASTHSALNGAAVVPKIGPVLLAFALGLGGGALLHSWLGASRERVVTRVVTKEVRVEAPVQVPAQAPVAEPPAPVTLAPSAPSDGTPLPATTAATRHKGTDKAASADSFPTNDGALAGEAALLLRAQTALSRGATSAAIAALREHARRFPSGQLIEEREALWVQALLVQGDREAAAARAAQFAKHYPTSPQREVIERALEHAP